MEINRLILLHNYTFMLFHYPLSKSNTLLKCQYNGFLNNSFKIISPHLMLISYNYSTKLQSSLDWFMDFSVSFFIRPNIMLC